MRDADTMQITVERIKAETKKAILVEFLNTEARLDEVWLPKSQIDYKGDKGDENVVIEIPEWLADNCGLDHLN
jgi:hypothetical protein